jgi:alpha-beta hydrolase superfamily lysophospholipase
MAGQRGSRLLSVGISLVSRALLVRDAARGVVRRMRQPEPREKFFFASGGRRLAAVWVAGPEGTPVILLCHGIGETVGHWGAVQAYLRERGVGSLVFNYSGYGKSTGRICTENCDADFVSAYAELRRRVGTDARVFVIGFSLGSGIAASGVGGLVPPLDGLFLCQAFSSLREAMQSAWVPARIARAFPNIWDTVEVVRTLHLPICVVHSDGDGLFPVAMAQQIVDACGERGELVIVPGFSHNEPYLKPTDAYWGPIVERVLRGFEKKRLT